MSDAQSSPPVVYMCANCDQIIGDSYSLLEKDSNFIILRSAPESVVVGQTLNVLKAPYDGCTFLNLSCIKCRCDLGCLIKSTSSEWDHYRGSYHFAGAKIKLFQLGQPLEKSTFVKDDRPVELSRLDQLETILLAFHHRLSAIENSLGLQNHTTINSLGGESSMSKSNGS